MAPTARRQGGGRVWRRERTARAVDRRQSATREDRTTGPGSGFFGPRAQSRSRAERKAMIDRTHRLSVPRQARLLGLSRAPVYYTAQPATGAEPQGTRG